MRAFARAASKNLPLSVAAAGFAVVAVQTLTGVGGHWLQHLDDQWIYDGVIVLAGLNCFICAWNRSDRIVWLAVGTAILFWGAGDIYWTQILQFRENVPFPSLADGGYLLFYPPAYVALVLLFKKEVRGIVRSLWLDGVVAALTSAGLAASIVYEIVARSLGSGLSRSALITNLAYPIGDIILLGIVVGAVALSGWRFSLKWLVFGGGLLIFAVADSVYLVQVATDKYVSDTILDLGWPAGMLLLAAAGTLPTRKIAAAQLEGYRLLAVPAACGVIALVLETIDHFRALNPIGVTLTTLALACVIVRMAMTFTDYLRLLERTRRESTTDSLTGLWNRRALVADLEATIEYGSSSSVLLLFDLNGFKSYNDRFGHPAGDALLARLGAQLEERVAGSGKAYRLGGDEFCALVRGSADDVDAIVAATTDALTEEGEKFRITSSVGTVVLPDEAFDTTEALKIVDRRMYRDKGSERGVGIEGRGALLGVLEARDAVLAEHTREVVRLSKAIAQHLDADVPLDVVITTAQLHDIGKVAIPDSILMKPGPLDESEWEVVRQHTIAGERIVGRVPGLEAVADSVRASHEHWNGKGYPDGLSGTEIPLVARVVTVADAYAAMTSNDRPYRAPLSPAEAEAEIRRCAGSQFDPVVVEALLAALASARAVAHAAA